MSRQTFVIAGASLAGAKAAEALREHGFDGRVVLIGSEPERPYERPPLSKDYLNGKVGLEKVYLHTNMLGFADAHDRVLDHPVAYERIPYFYSDQYEVGMEYSGHATAWDEVVFRGDPAAREFIAFWLRDQRILAGMNVNVWDVTDQIQALIRSHLRVDRDRLADPDTALTDLAPERQIPHAQTLRHR